MSGGFRARLFAAALLVPAATAAVVFAPVPALAQDDEDADAVSFGMFQDRLAPYGDWFESERWGYVWQPRDVSSDFRPYYNGHWVNTDRYGWYWVSDEDWGDIVYHYGRWVYDTDDGWLWIPGYVWAPAWVIWRQGEDSTGWFPMPPDDDFFAGDETYGNDWSRYADDDYYGYSNWYGPGFGATFFSLWVFVGDDHFGDRHFHRYARHDRGDRDDRDFFRRTRDATHYSAVDNYIMNRGVDPDALRRRTGQSFAPVRLRDIQRRDAPRPTPVDLGHRIQRHEQQARPNLMPTWFRRGETLKTSRFPGAQTPGFGPGATTPPRKERERFLRTAPGPRSPDGFAPNGGTPPDRVFTPRNLPAPAAVNPPAAPQGPGFDRRYRRQAPATNAPAIPPPPPEPRRFERFQPPPATLPAGNPPANVPARGFERVMPPPPPPAVAPVRTPPPAVLRKPPPEEKNTPDERHDDRERPRRHPQN